MSDLKDFSKVKGQAEAALTLSGLSIIIGIFAIGLLVLHWNSGSNEPDISYISASITILQTFIGIAALGGFWLIRGAAIEQAAKTATETVEKLDDEIMETAKLTARRAATDWLNDYYGRNASGSDSYDIARALDDDDDTD